MAILPILHMPDPVLRMVAKPVDVIDDAIQTLIDDMFETMYSVRGVGLAAPQVGVSIRLFVADVKGDKSQQIVFINPEIIEATGSCEYLEGCLSIPGVQETVVRAESITLQGLNREGQLYKMTVDGYLGECFQHEIDHLNGKLFVDLLSPLKRNIAQRKLKKYKRQHP